MSLNHIDEASKFKANNRNDQTYFPLIEKKPPRSYMIKSSSTIINQNERKQTNDLAKNIKNPEIFYKEMSQKLLFQKNEIEKRNEMITNLQKSFEEFRINYLKEKNDNMEKAKQIQNLKQMVTELTINNEVQAKTAKNNENSEILVIKKENEILKNLLTRKENEILLKEKIAGDMTYLENELKTTKKDLEQTKINNKELFDFNEKSVSQIKILEEQIEKKEAEINQKEDLFLNQTQEKNEREIILNKIQQDHLNEINEIRSESHKKKFLKEEERKNLKSEIMDLNYDIRKKEIELLELKNKLILSKEIEIKLASMNIELNEERKTSEILKNKLDILSNDYYKLMNDTKPEKKEKFNHLEKKTSLTFKNVNEEIKTLKTKIDGNIAKHIIKETSIKSNNNLDLTSHEKIKNLNQTNSNLTSFILILQNRLKLYEKDIPQNEIFQSTIEENIIKNVSCCKCHHLLNKAVTCIPCGHSYCHDCKSGYFEYCQECGKYNGSLDAVYRNELMDDMIKMVQSLPKINKVKNSKTFL